MDVKRKRLTPPGRGSLVVSVPERGKAEPLAQESRSGLKSDGGPSEDGGRYTQEQAGIALEPAETGKFHTPVEGTCHEMNSGWVNAVMRHTKEGEQDSAVGDLEVEGLIQDCECDTRIDVCERSRGSQASLVGKIDSSSCRCNIGQAASETHDEVWGGHCCGNC
jgi:hypothetical protein